MRDLRRELEAEPDEYPASWVPKPGDLITGEVVRYTEGTTSFGRSPIAVLRDDESGELRSVWLLHAVLRNEFAEQKPKPGERIGIKRLSDHAKGYKRYRLRVDRGQAEPEVPDFAAYEAPIDALEDPPQPKRPPAGAPDHRPEPPGADHRDREAPVRDEEPPVQEEEPPWV